MLSSQNILTKSDIMRTKLLSLLLISFIAVTVKAQNSQDVVDYYNLKIDELVSKWQDVSSDYDEEKTNHVYAKVFTSPVLYSSVIENAFGTSDESDESDMCPMDDKRADVIDGLMLNFYKEAPEHVAMTEDELRNEKSVIAYQPKISALKLNMPKERMPEDVVGGMKTTVVKPNYWKFGGRTSLTFTQNFISPNWFQGGDNYYAMLATVDLDLNYDDKNRLSWSNHFDLDLGFATAESDKYHKFKTNTDKIRIESTFGYKVVKTLDVAAKLKVESQLMPNYPSNSKDFISNCLAPLDANFSIGLNYKPTIRNFKLEVYLAPLSAYNFRYVHYKRIAGNLGIAEGNRGCFKLGHGLARHDFGTQLVVTVPTYQITSFLDVWSRLEYYTDYHRSFFQWEAKFNVAISKYFTASLMMHTRFDDSVVRNESFKEWGLWQLKELFTLGVAYAW